MTAPFLVTGGTGTLGQHVVPLLRQAGHPVRVLSRRPRPTGDGRDGEDGGLTYVTGNLLENEGVEAAVAGATTVVHLAGGPKGDDEATRNLVRAATEEGVRHLVLISVIGANRVPIGYHRMKLGTEVAVAESGIPWTTLRAAQFHELLHTVLAKMTRLPVVPAPRGVRVEPVDSRDVGARLAELALGEPAGLVPDLAGPTVYGLDELIHSYLRSTGTRRPVLPLPLPGKAGRALRAGTNLAAEGADRGRHTWEDFLSGRVDA
ncbi:NmrA family transcriptional regulator [Streptomyces xiamenensis]|uniref:NmrA family transcriptional regulator n=1 Tax=Streptomyces xiamenensis TaxID=408015 RepID=A0A0F7FRT4_9ACTN|nr:NAD(P)H-binding protein [Streptomyces xiamenensis]AKG42805.1 NmrA family transcriptional regulator [Streptomyces xiamenensis]